MAKEAVSAGPCDGRERHMAQVIFNFDTEDYTSGASDEAARTLADILTGEGVRGSFNVVGEVARRLAASPDRSCLEALGRHEINCHSLRHSWHPTIAEYCDTEDWTVGYRRFLGEETECVRLIRDAFRRDRLWAAVPPGNSIAMQAVYGYGQLGIPVYSDSLFKNTRGRGVWYCGTFHLESTHFVESLVFDNRLDAMLGRLDELAGWDRLVIFTHPNMAVYRQFWDALNMKGGNLTAWGRWKEPERRLPEETARYYGGFRRLVRALRDHGGFSVVTYEDVFRDVNARRRRALAAGDMPGVLEKANERFFHFEHGGHSYSLADAFFAAVHFLKGNARPWEPHDGLGPVDGPHALAETVTLGRDDLQAAAAGIAADGPIPRAIAVAGTPIGPGDFLRAAGAWFRGADPVVLPPGRAAPDVTGFFGMDRFRLENTWMHPDGFRDGRTLRRLLNQAWTIRLEKPD